MSSKNKNKKNNTNTNNTNTNTNNTSKQIDKFQNTKKEKFESTSYEDVIDFLSVSPSAINPTAITMSEQLKDFFILFMKNSFLVVILALNFLGLSVSLNCNADQEYSKRVFSAIFAFFFGFIYLIVNYYTYKVLSQGKICKMNRDKLFPFSS
jgi:hypothetical protein